MGVQVLDCTLRDGGYINNWEFGKQAICSILDKLESGGVDIIAVFFLHLTLAATTRAHSYVA